MLFIFLRQFSPSFRAFVLFILITVFYPTLAFLFILYFPFLFSFISMDIMLAVHWALLLFGTIPALAGYYAIMALTAIRFWRLAPNKWLSGLIIAIAFLLTPLIISTSLSSAFSP